MEHLLRDGGDLDSMDRSLLDYNHSKNPIIAQNGNGQESPPLPAPPTQYNDKAAINVSPATPLPTPISSPEGVTVMPVIKRDLVVRFTEQQNSVRCEMASSSGAAKRRGQENHAPLFKEQYEAQHYSRHPHGPTSPCDSENSVCNRSREKLIDTGKGSSSFRKSFQWFTTPYKTNKKPLLYLVWEGKVCCTQSLVRTHYIPTLVSGGKASYIQ